MTREIKFRAWDKKEKKMFNSGGSIKALANIEWFIEYDFELMQFTGLKDKNGKEIYEGDIVEHINRNCDKEIILPTKSIVRFGIEYVDTSLYEDNMTEINGFYLEPIDCKDNYEKMHYMSAFSNGLGIDIIGNIYETPELLK